MDMHMLLNLKWITNKDLLCSTGNSTQLPGSLDGRGVWGGIDTRICAAESLQLLTCNYHKLLIGYIPIQNKKNFFKEKFTMLSNQDFKI